MQKIVYLSNSRDYTEQGDINENKYFTRINKLLDSGWRVSYMTQEVVKIKDEKHPARNETMIAFVLLEKPDEEPDENQNEKNKAEN